MLRKILLFLFVCSPLFGANDFSAYPNCKALWRFENGALTVDSKGGNTLTAVNTPVADTVNFKEGAASVDLERGDGDYLYITDANLDAGFPLKNGDTNKKISVCLWVKPESLSTVNDIIARPICGKYATTGDKRSFVITPYRVADINYFGFVLGYNGGASDEAVYHTAGSPVVGRWYHIGITFQDSDKSYRIRIWDDTNNQLLGGSETTGTTTNNINVEDADWRIGHFLGTTNYFDGLIDECVVFNDILTAAEIDQIRAGIYVPAAAGGQVIIVE